MGVTMAFYIIRNEGLTLESIKSGLQAISEKRKLKAAEGLFAAYKESSGWFALFELRLCEGYCASGRDTDYLSGVFSSDAVAFSVFDSDVLFVSYSRFSDKSTFNHAKPNDEDYEEYDSDMYDTDFPEFLVPFCPAHDREKLAEIWRSEEYYAAEDRMMDICELIGVPVIDEQSEMPDGYEKLTLE
jgi:hypothetical protein